MLICKKNIDYLFKSGADDIMPRYLFFCDANYNLKMWHKLPKLIVRCDGAN